MPKAKSEKVVFYGTGRRKKSIARVRLVEGTGVITINGRSIDEYFGAETLKVIVRQPLTATNTVAKYDVICKVVGGGFTGQAGAIRHGIARALLLANSEFRPTLKAKCKQQSCANCFTTSAVEPFTTTALAVLKLE